MIAHRYCRQLCVGACRAHCHLTISPDMLLLHFVVVTDLTLGSALRGRVWMFPHPVCAMPEASSCLLANRQSIVAILALPSLNMVRPGGVCFVHGFHISTRPYWHFATCPGWTAGFNRTFSHNAPFLLCPQSPPPPLLQCSQRDAAKRTRMPTERGLHPCLSNSNLTPHQCNAGLP